jgi:hypothetical protein
MKITFENTNNFNFLVIKNYDISHINWFDIDYTKKLSELDIYHIVSTNSDNFLNDIADHLELRKYNTNSNVQVETQIIAEFPEYTYELLYLTIFDDKNKIRHDMYDINGVGTLLNLKEEHICHNCILLKNYLPKDSYKMIIDNCSINDIKFILDSRVNTKVVIYDNEWEEKKIIGDLETFATDFFDDQWQKLEIPFLKYNINIWYETLSFSTKKKDKITLEKHCFSNETFNGNNKFICGNLIQKTIYKCIWFTMTTDTYRGNLTLDEVQKIIQLSYKLDFPYQVKKEWENDELDSFQRNIIKNKFRILETAFKELISNT